MGNFFNKRDSGRRSGGRSERPAMHSAVCDKCGKDCEVPFRPSGDKPIYCSRCFENVDPKRGSRDSRDSRDSRGGGSSSPRTYTKTYTPPVDISPLKDELSDINKKLDVLIELLTPKEKALSKKSKK